MSIFSVSPKQKDTFWGKLTVPKKEIKGELKQRDHYDTSIRPMPFVSGKLGLAKVLFDSNIRKLSILFRFISARGKIIARGEARAGTAQAVTVEADTAQAVATEAAPAARPVTAVTVDARPVVSVFARATAYARAAASYIAHILTGHTAGATAAPGAVVEYSEDMKMAHTSKAEAAGSACAESRNVQATGTDAVAGTAQGVSSAAAVAFVAGNAAQAIAAPVAAVASRRAMLASHRADACAWFLPEYADGTMSLFQVFSGVQSADTVEVDLEESSAYWANNMNKGGELALIFTETVTQTGNILEVS